jgi:succinate-acetate transporter protein
MTENKVIIANETLSPTPLGLCTFGMLTILLSLANAGLIGLTSPIIAMGVFCGGVALIITAWFEWKKNNLFGFVTFGAFAFFWLSFVGILTLPALGLAAEASPIDMAAFLFVWLLLAIALLICSFRLGKLLIGIMGTLVILFACLVIFYATGASEPLFATLGGYAGIITGLLALYVGAASVVNDVYQKSVFPLF